MVEMKDMTLRNIRKHVMLMGLLAFACSAFASNAIASDEPSKSGSDETKKAL